MSAVGAPDILVNNAAVTFLRPLDGFPERRARLMMEMHVLAPLHLSQLAIPAMRERGRGWILNLTSVGGDLPFGPPFSEFDRTAGFGIYGTAKAALNRLTKSLAAELYDDGIAVNAAAPSNPVATPGAGALDLAKTDTEDIELITETAFRLCTGDPKIMTGRIAHTQRFLAEVGWSAPAGEWSSSTSRIYAAACRRRRHRRHGARRGCVEPDLPRSARRLRSGRQGCSARRRAGRAPRRAASGTHHQSACRDGGFGSLRLVGGRGKAPIHAPAVRDVLGRGHCVEPLFDGCPPSGHLIDRYRNACRVMAALHSLSPTDLGLGDEPVVDPVAEVWRWCDTLRTVDPALVPGWQGVRDALLASAPTVFGPSVVHGDFRLGNLIAAGARINAVIDWEIWAVGDPRIDAGWFLINCDPDTYQRVPASAGIAPPTAELAEIYLTGIGPGKSRTCPGSPRWLASSRRRRGH